MLVTWSPLFSSFSIFSSFILQTPVCNSDSVLGLTPVTQWSKIVKYTTKSLEMKIQLLFWLLALCLRHSVGQGRGWYPPPPVLRAPQWGGSWGFLNEGSKEGVGGGEGKGGHGRVCRKCLFSSAKRWHSDTKSAQGHRKERSNQKNEESKTSLKLDILSKSKWTGLDF